MLKVPVPYQRLAQLREALGLKDADLGELAAFRPAISRRREEFATRFHDAFMELAETRLLPEHEERPRFLLNAWSRGWSSSSAAASTNPSWPTCGRSGPGTWT